MEIPSFNTRPQRHADRLPAAGDALSDGSLFLPFLLLREKSLNRGDRGRDVGLVCVYTCDFAGIEVDCYVRPWQILSAAGMGPEKVLIAGLGHFEQGIASGAVSLASHRVDRFFCVL